MSSLHALSALGEMSASATQVDWRASIRHPMQRCGLSTVASAMKQKQRPLNTTDMPLHMIIPYENNPRAHPKKQIALLARLMKKYGVDQPIVVDEKNIILKGHGRLLAAMEAGFKTFPVVTRLGLNDDEKIALRIADNQVQLLSDWDDELLKQEIGKLDANFERELLGFKDAKIEAMFNPPDSKQQLSGLTFSVIVECEDEKDQSALLKKLGKMGLKCRALIS